MGSTSGNNRFHLGGIWLQISFWPKVVTETLLTFPGRKEEKKVLQESEESL